MSSLRLDFDQALESFLREELGRLAPDVSAAVRYAVQSPGKRIRPLLLMASYRALGGENQAIADLALSVELVHAYSLVHDDLPCMDDDVLRRANRTREVRRASGGTDWRSADAPRGSRDRTKRTSART
jgi:geranylgeranyl pyrophosphate synthase